MTAAVDNIVQLPFSKHWTLVLSDLPYDVHLEGGDDITTSIEPNKSVVDNIGAALSQPMTIRAAKVNILQAKVKTVPRNTLYVMVSIEERKAPLWKIVVQSCSKLTSIAVFITGTAMFASAQLLSIAMVVFVLTLVLAAGVFGRTIASWIVTDIKETEPMIHYVARDRDEANYILASLLTFELGVDQESGEKEPRKIQVEIAGYIFVGRRRIIRRSRLPVMLLGILAPTYDLLNASNAVTEQEDDHSGTPEQYVALAPK